MKNERIVTILITGGHITPALATAEELTSAHPSWQILFLGRKRLFEEGNVESEEAGLVAKAGYRFYPLVTGRFTRNWSFGTLLAFIRVLIGFVQALIGCLQIKPDVIVSFGGYVALPVVLAGWALGIPAITHEQTLVPGLANRIIGWFARRICVSFEEVVSYFPPSKTVVTGLPIRRALIGKTVVLPMTLSKTHPVLYITGGGGGAVSLNELIFPIVRALTDRFTVVHQTGKPSYAKGVKARESLETERQKRYRLVSYLDTDTLAGVLAQASLIIGRSGANSIMEFGIAGKIAILIPLPWSAGGEQLRNAQWLATHGGAQVLEQGSLTSDKLFSAIEDVWENARDYQRRADRLALRLSTDAAKRMRKEIEMMVGI